MGDQRDLQECLDFCARNDIQVMVLRNCKAPGHVAHCTGQSHLTTWPLAEINQLVQATHEAERKGKNVVVFET